MHGAHRATRIRKVWRVTEGSEGPGGKQIICEDPSGNVIELNQPPPSSDQ